MEKIEKTRAEVSRHNCGKEFIQLSTEVFPNSKECMDKAELALCAHI